MKTRTHLVFGVIVVVHYLKRTTMIHMQMPPSKRSLSEARVWLHPKRPWLEPPRPTAAEIKAIVRRYKHRSNKGRHYL